MPIITRIVPSNFSVIVNRPINPLQHRIIVSGFVALKLAEVQQINRGALGYAPNYKTTVDGQQSGSVLNLKVDGGKAVFDFEVADPIEVVEAALKALRDGSPVVSGAYRDAHTVFVEGEEVENLQEIKPSDQVIIANPIPYARRLEIGKTKSGRDFIVQAPNRLYERVTDQLITKFEGRFKIQFRYLELEGAHQITGKMQQRTPRYATGKVRIKTQTHWVGTSASGVPAHWETFAAGGAKTRIRRHKPGTAVQSPAIVISPLKTTEQ